MTNPCARRDAIVSEKLAAETILYDKASHCAHSLNQTVALVWQSADGRTSIDEIAGILHRDLGIPADRDVVLLALQELTSAGLLQEPAPAETGSALLTRRQVARRLALAGASAAMVPLVASVLAPTPAMAQSTQVNKSQAGQDLFVVSLEAGLDPSFASNKTAQTDLNSATTAYNQGNYNTEVSDLDGVLKALGLPPLQ